MTKFEALCALLPANTNWGDLLTPQIVEEIVWAERGAIEAELEALADECDDPAEAYGIRLALGKIKARSNAQSHRTSRASGEGPVD